VIKTDLKNKGTGDFVKKKKKKKKGGRKQHCSAKKDKLFRFSSHFFHRFAV